MTTKYSSTTKFIEDDYKFKFEKALKEKDDELKKHLEKIDDLLSQNESLSHKFDENVKDYECSRRNYTDKIHELQLIINKKDMELNEMKHFYEDKIDSLYRNFEEEKSRIINNYEDNFNKYNHVKLLD